MTEEATSKAGRNIGLIVVAILVAAALAVVVGVALLMSVLGGSAASEESAAAVCVPDETDSGESGVEVPAEYEDAITAAAAESGFSAEVIAAQIHHESSWNPQAESPVGAQGIAQFMPATWESFGEGDIMDPDDSITAQGRYMGYLRDLMEDQADDEEHLVQLALASYNAGEGAVAQNDYDLEALYDAGAGYRSETAPYVENIMTAASGSYTSSCAHAGSVPEGDITEASMHLAWDERVSLPNSSAGDHGREEAKPEFVEVADSLSTERHTAYYTDCGVFVASAVISSGVDPDFPRRSTGVQLSYVQGSDDYEVFIPSSEGELEPGDILIGTGHIYIYTGERNASETGRAQGASLFTRPPSGHHFFLSDSSNGTYYAARHTG